MLHTIQIAVGQFITINFHYVFVSELEARQANEQIKQRLGGDE